jgi:hypothetical protein
MQTGGGAEFLTLTLPHTAGCALGTTRRLAADAWKRVQQGRGWLAIRKSVEITGTIRVLEVTHGINGWHPHMHVLVLTGRPLIASERGQLLNYAFTAWRQSVVLAGQKAPLREHTTISAVRDVTDVAQYVTKLGAALEMTQGAAKEGRRTGQRTPFAILSDFLRDADAADLELWQTWERGIKGARQLTWSRGLRALYGVPAVDDETLAAEEQGGALVATLTADEWEAVRRAPSGAVLVLEAAERGGAAAVALLVAALVARWASTHQPS